MPVWRCGPGGVFSGGVCAWLAIWLVGHLAADQVGEHGRNRANQNAQAVSPLPDAELMQTDLVSEYVYSLLTIL